MSEILDQAKVGIQNWNIARNDSPITIPVFNSGSFFKITSSNYSTWKNSLNTSGYKEEDQNIHAYLSLDQPTKEGQLSLYAVDNYTDSLPVIGHEPAYTQNLQFLSYEPANLYNVYFNKETFDMSGIDPLHALEQSTQWTLHKDLWLDNQNNMTQILVIPFGDIKVLFEQTNADFLVAQPAFSLKGEEGAYILEMDLIIWGYSNYNGIIGKYPRDLIQPVPPYSGYSAAAFQLLQYSI
ncbi:MAG: hypothetical protein ACRBFS_05505 [Aureispira sp.]